MIPLPQVPRRRWRQQDAAARQAGPDLQGAGEGGGGRGGPGQGGAEFGEAAGRAGKEL